MGGDAKVEGPAGNGGQRETVAAEAEKMSKSDKAPNFPPGRLRSGDETDRTSDHREAH